MTTREELVALRDWLRRPDYADEFSLADVVERMNQRPVAAIERLSSRQEVSVEELARLIEGPLSRRSFENRVEGYTLETSIEQARALRAEYSITNRTE